MQEKISCMNPVLPALLQFPDIRLKEAGPRRGRNRLRRNPDQVCAEQFSDLFSHICLLQILKHIRLKSGTAGM